MRYFRHRDVALVTAAPKSRPEEIDDRRRRYMITMGIRTVLFALSVFLFRGVARYIAAGLSLVMPYFAVVLANAGPKRVAEDPQHVRGDDTGQPALVDGRTIDGDGA